MPRTRHSVLLAVCGTSPAVITETVQAIYWKYNDVVIDEVIVVTTTIGKAKLVSQLLDSDAWNQLKTELNAPPDTLRWGDCEDSIRVIASLDKTRNLADICSPEDHLAMANQLCNLIRAYADNPNITILASLAGGRKTMSTMMGFCFSLYAREQDKLFHVLVNEPFDGKMEPMFLFKPNHPVMHKLLDGRIISSNEAKIDLIEIPCVHLRKLFPQQFGKAPGNYSSLVKTADYIAGMGDRQIRLELKTGKVTIGATTVILGDASPALFWVYWSVAKATKEDVPLLSLDDLCAYIKRQHEQYESFRWICRPLQNSLECKKGNISKAMTKLKEKLCEQGEPYRNYCIIKKKTGSYRLNLDSRLIVLMDASGK